VVNASNGSVGELLLGFGNPIPAVGVVDPVEKGPPFRRIGQELRRDTTSVDSQLVRESWSAEAIFKSPLGYQLRIIAQYVEHSYWGSSRAQVEQAMQRVLRMVFGNSFDEGYTIPAKFHTTELGKLFHEAYSNMCRAHDLLTVKQAYLEAGVARQSVYDRIADGKLHPIYLHGDIRLHRSEIEEWKAQRARRD